MTSSGTYNWSLDNAGLVTEAFSRLSIHPTALTREHFQSATRSLNLALAAWSNRGPNLWQIELISIPLLQGVPTYTLPSNIVNILDAYIETYQLGTIINQAPNFSTEQNSTTVDVTQDNHGLTTGNYVDITTPVSVGGLILSGFYTVSVLSQNAYSIQAASAATSTVNNGGVVPAFTAVINSALITCVLPNHGLFEGENFNVNVATEVGGLSLFGSYTIGNVVDVNTFTFTAAYQAAFNDTEYENAGQVQIMTQQNSAQPFDRIMTSISRTDYAAQPNKLMQAPPTTFWFDRLSPIPSVTLWQVPDQNGPYAMFMYCMRRVQDAYATSGQTPDIPYRFLDALAADLAYRLGRKYAPALIPMLKADRDEAWMFASEEDRERVELFLSPDLSGYYNF